jgi:membrane protein DedA with SNARE-associated domain
MFLLALSTLVSEDLACIAAGVLIAQGRVAFWPGTAACAAGITAGDLLLFLAGRLGGRHFLTWKPVRALISASQVARASSWLAARGMAVVLLSRFTPGLRLPTYVAAGMLGDGFWRFFVYFAVAAAVWTPLLVGATILFGAALLQQLFAVGVTGGRASLGAMCAALLVVRLVRPLGDFAVRRKLLGYWLRIVRWEFWPVWAMYLPLVPYFVYLSVRYRSMTVFTAANPGIFSSGLIGESKSDILRPIESASGVVARFCLIRAALDPDARLEMAVRFLREHDLTLPVVLKPDVGERGRGVVICHAYRDFVSGVLEMTEDTILQEYVPGIEVGISYCRLPGESSGCITSITEKRFPVVIGDGFTSLEGLILRDCRAVCMASRYLGSVKGDSTRVLKAGERMQLVELGSHCRGAIFGDGRKLLTEPLKQAIDRISQSRPGFFLGRFDIRAESMEALKQGRFRILELNGVSGEPAHIYDPSVSLLDAYRALSRQWKSAFEIGSLNRALGAGVMTAPQIFALLRR